MKIQYVISDDVNDITVYGSSHTIPYRAVKSARFNDISDGGIVEISGILYIIQSIRLYSASMIMLWLKVHKRKA